MKIQKKYFNSVSSILCSSVENSIYIEQYTVKEYPLIVHSATIVMSKKKELLAIGAVAASFAAGFAASYFKNENKPDKPDMVGDLVKNASAGFDDEDDGEKENVLGQINRRDNASINQKETDDLTGDDW